MQLLGFAKSVSAGAVLMSATVVLAVSAAKMRCRHHRLLPSFKPSQRY